VLLVKKDHHDSTDIAGRASLNARYLRVVSPEIYQQRSVESGDNNSKNNPWSGFMALMGWILSLIYPESCQVILGKFERVIHISYTLSTVFG